jgi:hypothetical protein
MSHICEPLWDRLDLWLKKATELLLYDHITVWQIGDGLPCENTQDLTDNLKSRMADITAAFADADTKTQRSLPPYAC